MDGVIEMPQKLFISVKNVGEVGWESMFCRRQGKYQEALHSSIWFGNFFGHGCQTTKTSSLVC